MLAAKTRWKLCKPLSRLALDATEARCESMGRRPSADVAGSATRRREGAVSLP